jgi:hypothetical protein
MVLNKPWQKITFEFASLDESVGHVVFGFDSKKLNFSLLILNGSQMRLKLHLLTLEILIRFSSILDLKGNVLYSVAVKLSKLAYLVNIIFSITRLENKYDSASLYHMSHSVSASSLQPLVGQVLKSKP